MNLEWRQSYEPGVTLDGTWITYETLEALLDRQQNTEITGQDPLHVYPDVKRVLVARGLAQEQTRGGVFAGPALRAFSGAITLTPRPVMTAGDPYALLDQARRNLAQAGANLTQAQGLTDAVRAHPLRLLANASLRHQAGTLLNENERLFADTDVILAALATLLVP